MCSVYFSLDHVFCLYFGTISTLSNYDVYNVTKSDFYGAENLQELWVVSPWDLMKTRCDPNAYSTDMHFILNSSVVKTENEKKNPPVYILDKEY